MKTKAFKVAFPLTIPVLAGYLFIGMAFGILSTSSGYNIGWILLMSTTIFAGSMQFVAINLLTSSFNIVSVIFMTLMINARHLFYGLSMLDKFKDMGKKKPYMIFSLTDETFSLLCGVDAPEGVDKNWFYFFIAILNQGYWILGSVIGGVLGSIINFNTKGIEFVMTALFVVIFLDQWDKNKNHIPALIGVFVSLVCLIIFGSKHFILPSMVVIALALTVFKKPIEQGESQ
ncbi:MAG TPA: branched-chain amino acid ABC transporter permease [Epulopiscium sp.]|nr:branched-chain amino acid ABC transporter permease [Candidatus Epulonipiscium sp.]